MGEILVGLPEVDGRAGAALRQAARLHDWGKAHYCFQRMLLSTLGEGERAHIEAILGCALDGLWPAEDRGAQGVRWLAKSARKGGTHVRRHFRHELASALAVVRAGGVEEVTRDLVAYLVAAHHGKARLGLRALPGEDEPQGRAFALGVWDGDQLPDIQLADGTTLPPVTLDLEAIRMGDSADGAPSWLERILRLRDTADWGPFRLAYLEALLRAADMRASATPTFFADIPAGS